jgi:hypothetical protein
MMNYKIQRIIWFLKRKFDLLSSLSGERCKDCGEFLNIHGSCESLSCEELDKKRAKSWVDYNIERVKHNAKVQAQEEKERSAKAEDDYFQLEDVKKFLT